MIVLILFIAIALIITILSKNFVLQIISIKIVADAVLLIFYSLNKSQEELRSLGWIFFSLAMSSIFLIAISSLHKSIRRGAE